VEWQPTLVGEGLRLRPLTCEDWPEFLSVGGDPAIWAQHPAHDRWQEPVLHAFFLASLATGGAMAITDAASGAMIGASRWDRLQPEEDLIEIGGTFLATRWWGGPTNWACKRLMMAHAYRFVSRIEFHIGEDNRRSRIAIERIGAWLTDRRDIMVMAGEPKRHVYYEITRDQFANGPLMASPSQPRSP